DTGPGIRAEDQDRIFEQYEQANGNGARPHGTGLGLSLSRRLGLVRGGSIDVESEPGRGASFTVRLPSRVPSTARSQPPGHAARETVATTSLLRRVWSGLVESLLVFVPGDRGEPL